MTEITEKMLLAMSPADLLALDPADFIAPFRQFSQKEIEAIFKACDAMWVHSGDPKAPHAELTSGKCSDGYINCSLVLSRSNLCQIMAQQMVARLESCNCHARDVDWVVGSDSAALGLSKDAANLLNACWHPMQKGPDKTQLWEKMVIPEGAKVLHVEELMTTAITSRAVRQGIKDGNPHPVNFVPFLPVLIHRPAPGEGNEVDGSQVIWLAHYDIFVADPSECPLCKAGSKPLRPKDHWAELTGTVA